MMATTRPDGAEQVARVDAGYGKAVGPHFKLCSISRWLEEEMDKQRGFQDGPDDPDPV